MQDTVFGIHAVRILLRRRPADVAALYVASTRRDGRIAALVALALPHRIEVSELPLEELGLLARGGKHQGVVAWLRSHVTKASTGVDQLGALIAQHHAEGTRTLLLALDGVQDPHNLGACWRSAGAAGAHGLIIPQRRSAPVNATVKKVASGASELVPCCDVPYLARTRERLAADGVRLVGAVADAKRTLYDVDLCEPTAFVLGAESRGLRRLTAEKCDALVRIPMPGLLESLNVSVAAGVLLFEAIRQRGCFGGGARSEPL